MHAEAGNAQRPGEWLALAALLAPWLLLSMLLPLAHLAASVALIGALAMLAAAAAHWSRLRAAELGLDPEAWGLAASLSLGFSMAFLLGRERSGFEALCGGCGSLADARASFCYACGAYA